MAHDEDRTSDQFIREVNEELRREQLKALWNRFGIFIIAAAVLIVLVTGGYTGWVWWTERQAAQHGDLYLAALDAAEAGDRERADEMLGRLIEEGSGGYPVLARLTLAAAKVEAGEVSEAILLYDSIADDARLEAVVRDLARLRSAILALDQGDVEGATSRAEPLAVSGSPWRHSAREVLGTAAFREGRLGEAREQFLTVQQDAEAPQDLRGRASLMVALIDGMGVEGAETPESAADDADEVGATGGQPTQ
jgi:hypothetical protein